MTALSDSYSIVWLRYDRSEEGCITHAQEDGSGHTVCGLAATEGGIETLTDADGHVGCKRCIKGLTKRGILPFSITLTKDARGEWVKVAVQ